MLIYFIPLFLLALLTIIENIKKFQNFIRQKYLFYFVAITLIIFICFRYEIGCDWPAYENKFSLIKDSSIGYIFANQKQFFDIGYSIIAKLISYKFNFSVLNIIYGLLFTIPLLFFVKNIKRSFLALMISYPYFIVVVGMGPLRQSAAIGFFMLCIVNYILKRKKLFYFYSIISILLHHSAILFIGILSILNELNNKEKSNGLYRKIFYFLILIFVISVFPVIIPKIMNYIDMPVSKTFFSRGAYFIWFINLIPSILYLTNISKFNFQSNLKNLLKLFAILEIFFLPILIIYSVLSYRLLLYFFPISIFITSYLPDSNIFNLRKNVIISSLVLLCFLSLLAWLKFAYHSNCWLPYQNILF